MKKFASLLLLALLTTVLSVNAQTTGAPSFQLQQFADLSIVNKVSDNGKWAIVKGATGEQKKNGNVRILNTETKEYTILKLEKESEADAIGKYMANDITDDGNIVVGGFNGTLTDDGSFLGIPGFFNMTTKEWVALPLLEGTTAGQVHAVTPDGKYAVGVCEDNPINVMSSNTHGVMWNLETRTMVTLENLPKMPVDYSCKLEQYTDISADGKFISIYGNQAINPTAFIYNTVEKKSIRFGIEGKNSLPGFNQLDGSVVLSPNGKYAAATVRDTEDNLLVAVLNLETETYTAYNNIENLDQRAGHVDNNGNVYASSPSGTAVREWSVVCEGIWYPFSLIMNQRYNRDFYKATNFENTGTLWAGSADGHVLGSMVSPQGESYIVTLPESINDACKNIDLLQSFTPTPSAGAAFHWIDKVTFLFTQNIAVKDSKATATLKDSNGNVVLNSIGMAVSQTDSHTLVVTFREKALTAGETYTVEIPEGALCLAANDTKVNKAISVSYVGRGDAPVAVTDIYPANESEVPYFDNETFFPVLTFETKVVASEKASASLYEITSDGEKKISSLSVIAKGEKVALMPPTVQYLYSGAKYKVVLEAGSVTDVVGDENSGNAVVTLNYTGTYVRQVSTETAILFSEDFNSMASSLANMMRYEGDHNTPTTTMQAWGFDADNEPWNFSIRESETTADICAASTSMYSPKGQSDDWMVTPQLTIPDEFCTLTFDAQSYDDLSSDKLNIVIWACDENINTLTSDIISKMKSEGEITSYELNIGKTAEGLEGEYTKYAIDLAKYAGKKIYIGFWNNNKNESVIFVDNILVQRNLKYLLYLLNPETVVKKESQEISGMLYINSDVDTFSSVTLTLNDSQGNVLDTKTENGLSLKKDDFYEFAFEKPLPLTVGEVNEFTIGIKLDSYSDVSKNSIKNLTFEPVKRVVLEELTGTTCPNCPQGIVAIEYLEKLYGDRFIPISLHTYDGDPYSSTTLEQYTQSLGLAAAPSGIVQRNGYIISPMSSSSGSFVLSNGMDLWADFVAAEMKIPSYIGVKVAKANIDEETGKIKMELEIESALNLKNQYINVFPIAMEDGLVNSQLNNFYTYAEEALGDWGKGGKYAQYSVNNITHNDVARTYWGTVKGTNIGFPQTLEAGKTYSCPMEINYPEQVAVKENGKIAFMFIDGVTNYVINAVVLPMKDISTGIENAVVDNSSDIRISASAGDVLVVADGEISVSIFSASGSLLNTATGNGSVTLSADGYKGAVIVKAQTATKTAAKTVIM